jgi:hypothetical protein
VYVVGTLSVAQYVFATPGPPASVALSVTRTAVLFQPAAFGAGALCSVVTGGGGLTLSVTGTLTGVLSAPDAATLMWPVYVPYASEAGFTDTEVDPPLPPVLGEHDSHDGESDEAVHESVPPPELLMVSN